MHTSPFLVQLVLLIATAALGVALFERLRLPSVVGFLVTGVLIGPGVFGLIGDPESVLTLAEFGVVFLLFEIGLELPLDRLRRSWRVTLPAGALQVGVTLAAASAVAMAFGVEIRAAFVVGALIAMSSTAVVMRLLTDRGEIDAPHGQLSVGVLLFQDLCIVPFLLVLPLLAGGATGSAGIEAVAGALLRALLAIAVFVGVARFVLPPVLDYVAKLQSRELFSLVAVLVVVGGSVVAEVMGLTLAVGAFLAGVVLSASPYGTQLKSDLLSLRGILLGVFFTAVGMLLDPMVLVERPQALLVFLAASILLKAAIVYVAVDTVLRQGRRIAVLCALTLAQTGEFSFVLGRAAIEAGVLSEELGEQFIAASVLSLLATPFLVRAAPTVATWLTKGVAGEGDDERAMGRRGHVVLVGYGLTGRTLGRVLTALDVPWVAVEANARSVEEALRRGEDVIFGDATSPELLEHLGVAGARAIAVSVNDPLSTRQVVEITRQLNREAPVFARTRYVLEVDRLAETGATDVVADEVEGTLDLLAGVLRTLGHPSASIDRFLAELREEGYGALRGPVELGIDPWLLELLEGTTTEWVDFEGDEGRTLAEFDLRARAGCAVLALERGGVTTPNPPADTIFGAGDRVLLFGTRESVAHGRAILLGDDPGES